MYNKPYEKTLTPYSPESVKEGIRNPNMAEPEHEKLIPFSQPEIPKSMDMSRR
jgi:hypothetical protein